MKRRLLKAAVTATIALAAFGTMALQQGIDDSSQA